MQGIGASAGKVTARSGRSCALASSSRAGVPSSPFKKPRPGSDLLAVACPCVKSDVGSPVESGFRGVKRASAPLKKALSGSDLWSVACPGAKSDVGDPVQSGFRGVKRASAPLKKALSGSDGAKSDVGNPVQSGFRGVKGGLAAPSKGPFQDLTCSQWPAQVSSQMLATPLPSHAPCVHGICFGRPFRCNGFGGDRAHLDVRRKLRAAEQASSLQAHRATSWPCVAFGLMLGRNASSQCSRFEAIFMPCKGNSRELPQSHVAVCSRHQSPCETCVPTACSMTWPRSSASVSTPALASRMLPSPLASQL